MTLNLYNHNIATLLLSSFSFKTHIILSDLLAYFSKNEILCNQYSPPHLFGCVFFVLCPHLYNNVTVKVRRREKKKKIIMILPSPCDVRVSHSPHTQK